MKLKEGFALRQVADTWVVMPLGEKSVDFNGMLTLNDTGAVLWQALEKGGDRDTLIDALVAEYDVSREVVASDVDAFIDKLAQAGCLDL